MNARRWRIIRTALRTVWRFPLRSSLLTITSALGVAGVICSVNYGASGSRQLFEQIEKLGTNVLIITPAQSRAIAGRARTGGAVTTLVERDYAALEKEVTTRVRSSAIATASFWTKAGDFSKNAVVFGCEPDYFGIKNWPVAEGTLFDALEERSLRRVAVLGHTAAIDLFGDADPIGARLLINRVPFTVTGVLTERGQGLDVGNEDRQIYVPLATAMRRLMNTDHYSGIVLEIEAGNEMDSAEQAARSILRQLHRTEGRQAEDFQIQNQESMIETQTAASARLSFLVTWIGASALVVCAAGILGITTIAIRQRTREIGTSRALGATASDVFLQMVAESGAVSIAGCLTGLAVSWPASSLLSNWSQLPLVYDRRDAIIAVCVASGVNLVFSLVPARRASGVQPAEALKYE